jgi:hypothetical protein
VTGATARLALLAAAAVLGVASALAAAGVMSGAGADACPEPSPGPPVEAP